jgi:hypothetical protein
MGFLDFLKGDGGGIVSSVLGGGMGLIGSAINAKAQKEMQEASFEYGREMMEKQNQAELQRMGLQFDYNKKTAQYNQDLARGMYDYTFDKQNAYNNPAAEKERYEAAGLNPALLYGSGGGSGGGTSATTTGGQMPPVTSIQPMGVQVALQAEAQKAQIELTKAQTNSIKADTMKKVTADMASAGLDMVGKMLANKGSEVNNRKAEQEIQNLKKTNEQITENIGKIKEDKKIVEFENWLNELKKEATMLYNDGSSISFESLYRANEWSKLKTELEELNFRNEKAIFERNKLEGLFDNLDKIIKGEIDGYQLNTKKYEEMDWNLKNDKAFGDLLEELGTDSKYSKLLLAIIRYFANKK